ncbi:glycoside hydrolase family 71 protein [Mycena floridula]|nr:glycoside hydrolase family 71 protein [Mycena floridula]
MRLPSISLLLPFVTSVLALVPLAYNASELVSRQTSTGSLVFCHFMIGIMSNRGSPADYDGDMQRAKALGIDAFALNIGVDPYTDAQLGYAYQSAANNNMKVFISFDFNWYHDTSDASAVGAKVAQYGGLPAQLHVDGKVFASSFAGDQLNIAAVKAAANGLDLMIVPNWHPELGTNFAPIDGALNWMGWDNDGNNKAPKPGQLVTVADGDNRYLAALGSKYYLAPVSPWFSTHFGPEVPYSKNWVFPGDLLWYNRWWQILAMKPRFIEIVTWNDYGESHYVGPLSSSHTDDGASKWVNDMPHGGWLDMAVPFIAAFHAGASTPDAFIQNELITYWYRVAPRDLNCDSTDTTMQPASNSSGNYFEGRPDGYATLQDQVFVVAELKSPGTIQVNSGDTVYTFNAPAGASAFSANFVVGPQTFSLLRGGSTVMSETSLKQISNTCTCGLYNFNAYVGTVPAAPSDPLRGPGFGNFANGLKVGCSPQPSLPASPPSPANPTTTISIATTTTAGGGGTGPTTTVSTSTTSVTSVSTTTTSSTTTTTTSPGGTSTIVFGKKETFLGLETHLY